MTIITRMWIFGTQFGASSAVDSLKCIAWQISKRFVHIVNESVIILIVAIATFSWAIQFNDFDLPKIWIEKYWTANTKCDTKMIRIIKWPKGEQDAMRIRCTCCAVDVHSHFGSVCSHHSRNTDIRIYILHLIFGNRPTLNVNLNSALPRQPSTLIDYIILFS